MKEDLKRVKDNLKRGKTRVIFPHTCFPLLREMEFDNRDIDIDVLFISKLGEIKMEYIEKWSDCENLILFDDCIYGCEELTRQIFHRGDSKDVKNLFVISVMRNGQVPKWDAQKIDELQSSDKEFHSLIRGDWDMWVERNEIIGFIRKRVDR